MSTSIESLPKDVLGLIFQKLWRKDAKSIPMTCKLFRLIITNERWFKGWQTFEITIQELPSNIYKSLQEAANRANVPVTFGPPKTVKIQYDHFDTLFDVLNRFKNSIINNQNWSKQVEYNSLYGLDEHDNTFTFLRGNLLVNEIKKLPIHQQSKLYCSDFTFQELEENKRTYFNEWDGSVSDD